MNNSFKDYLELQGKSKSTISHYNSHVLDFIAWLDRDNTEIENCTAKEVLSYLNHLQKKGQSNKTRGMRLGVIKQFFNWQIEQGRLSANPITHLKIRGTKTQKLYPLLNRQELEQIYINYQIPDENDPRQNRNWFRGYKLSKERNRIILSLLINQGLTTTEISRLTVFDLKLRQGEIYIAGTRKSNERTLKLKSNQVMDLMESLQLRKLFLPYQENKSVDRLFLSLPTAGRSSTAKEMTLSIFKGLTKEIKIQNPNFINFKQVRTTVITNWLKQYNLREVQYMAGHRYVSSTEAYLINQVEDLQMDIDKFHPLSGIN